MFLRNDWFLIAGGMGGGNLGPGDWPQGCLGYAFNLVRPARPGHRASLLYSLLGNVLVFVTLQDASAYRELVTQVSSALLLACKRCCEPASDDMLVSSVSVYLQDATVLIILQTACSSVHHRSTHTDDLLAAL